MAPVGREIVAGAMKAKPPEFVDRTPAEINMLPTDRHSRIPARLISLQIAFYIPEIVLGMLLPAVIHNARNIRPGQQPTKASFNRRPRGTAVTFPSLSSIQKASTTATKGAPRSFPGNYARYFLIPAEILPSALG